MRRGCCVVQYRYKVKFCPSSGFGEPVMNERVPSFIRLLYTYCIVKFNRHVYYRTVLELELYTTVIANIEIT